MIWYKENFRSLPWRESSDPYIIWLSEIILQQTRVEQGLPYFMRFSEQFPTVHHLAQASEEAVMKCWQGLGYYSRARNLHKTAKYVSENLDGVFPSSYHELLKLNGVGPYTAAAIASFAFGEAVPVVDGNVYRFISRYLAIDMPIATPQASRYFSEVLYELMPKNEAGLFNQALMEFGSLLCTPRQPGCSRCPFREDCAAHTSGRELDFPVKGSKTKVKDVFYHFIILKHENKIWLSQRDDSGLWKKLWHFPMFETQSALSTSETIDRITDELGILSNQLIFTGSWNTLHLLSHRRIQAVFWEFDCHAQPQKEGLLAIDSQEIQNYPLPQIMVKYLKNKEE